MSWEILGYAAVAAGAGQLLWLLGLQLLGDMREAGLQARVKRLAAKKPPKTTIVVLVGADTPVAEVLDSVLAEPATEILVFAPARSKAYGQARRYRQKQPLGTRVRVLQRPAPEKLLGTIHARAAGTVLVILGEDVHANGMLQAIRPLGDSKVQTVVLTPRIRADNSLSSGLYASWQVLARHFGRAYRRVPVPGHGLAVRKTALRAQARRKQPVAIHAVADIWNVLPAAARSAAVSPRAAVLMAGRPASWRDLLRTDVAVKHVLLLLIGPTAVVAALLVLGSYQGMVVLGFAALLLMFLAAVAILSESRLTPVSRLNLLLLAPFAYAWYVFAALLALARLPFRFLKP